MKHFVPDMHLPSVPIDPDPRDEGLKRHLKRCAEARALRRAEMRIKHLERNRTLSAAQRRKPRQDDSFSES